MSRIGKKAIALPAGVSASVQGDQVVVQGPKGKASRRLPAGLAAVVEGTSLRITTERADDRRLKALHGLTRTLVANDVLGLSKGFERGLEIQGVGYRAELAGRTLKIAVGYSHPIEFPLPPGIDAAVQDRPVRITLRGTDRELIGRTAASLRALRPPEPYKGKGIRYEGEVVKTKVGKTGLK